MLEDIQIIECTQSYQMWKEMDEYIEWVMPKTIVLDNGNEAEFVLVKYKGCSLDNADYNCYIYEFGKNKEVVEQYWRGFRNDYYTGKLYGRFMDSFVASAEYRNRYNIKNGTVIKKEYKGKLYSPLGKKEASIDSELYDVIVAYNSAGFGTSSSCMGTRFPWSDSPGLSDGHQPLAFIHFDAALPDSLIEILWKCPFVDAEKGMWRVESSERKYNYLYAEILMDALEEYRMKGDTLMEETNDDYGMLLYTRDDEYAEIIEERTDRTNSGNGNYILFNLVHYGHTSDNNANRECFIYERDSKDKLVNQYWRCFKDEYFTEDVYKAFIAKFSEDELYRKIYDIRNGKREKNKDDRYSAVMISKEKIITVDEVILDAVFILNKLGYETSASCKGSSYAWKDYPSVKDFHNPCAYIEFKEPITAEFAALFHGNEFVEYKEGAYVIKAKSRDYNSLFPDIIKEAITRQNPSE